MSDGTGTGSHWFEPLAEHLGSAYLRYSFTYGTEQEVDFLFGVLGLGPGTRVLDVGCGPGRHAHALARRGMRVHGIDISSTFVALAERDAPGGATFERADARLMRFDEPFDVALSLCQGAFGLAALPGVPAAIDPDGIVLARMAEAIRPGGTVVVSAFSAYFQVRNLGDLDTFDAATGVNHEHTEIRDPDGRVAPVDLWTSCFTPRELRLLARAAGLEVEDLWAVTPGDYAARPPDLEHPEFLLVARRPGPAPAGEDETPAAR
jgi:SAM-dependent methyltransferase